MVYLASIVIVGATSDLCLFRTAVQQYYDTIITHEFQNRDVLDYAACIVRTHIIDSKTSFFDLVFVYIDLCLHI